MCCKYRCRQRIDRSERVIQEEKFIAPLVDQVLPSSGLPGIYVSAVVLVECAAIYSFLPISRSHLCGNSRELTIKCTWCIVPSIVQKSVSIVRNYSVQFNRKLIIYRREQGEISACRAAPYEERQAVSQICSFEALVDRINYIFQYRINFRLWCERVVDR